MKDISAMFHKIGFQARRHSPEILVVTGIVGTVVGAVMACKATLKLSAILDSASEKIEKVHKVADSEELKKIYSEEDSKKDLAVIYIQTGVKVARLYAPSLAIEALSIASILGSHNILRKRNVALAAAYTAVDNGFKNYRSRVVERFGERVDKELRHGVKAVEVTETISDEKTGEPKEVTKTLDMVDPDNSDSYSDYARFFDEGSPYWEKNSEFNLMFLRTQQQHANDRLQAQRYLFLNDVYRSLGIPCTKAGQVVGWIYDPENNEHDGDNFVDFGIYNVHSAAKRDFVNGYEQRILLDFNVDGPILDRFK